MLVFPNIKINIGLNVITKRTDGYHDIESIFYPIRKYTDCLEILPSAKFRLEVYGNKIPCKLKDNIIYKAYDLIRKKFQIPPVSVILYKNIPTGSGLGGGSSNGTSTLILLNKLFDLKIPDDQVEEMSLKLGSDCPFFIYNKPMLIKGRGEVMQPCNLDLSKFYLTIITPPLSVSTKEAYEFVSPQKPAFPVEEITNLSVPGWKNYIKNDFEKFIEIRFPEIIRIKEKLYDLGAIYASVSGSGSSVYGISEEKLPVTDFPTGYKIWQEAGV